jgi:hypothetical protein
VKMPFNNIVDIHPSQITDVHFINFLLNFVFNFTSYENEPQKSESEGEDRVWTGLTSLRLQTSSRL